MSNLFCIIQFALYSLLVLCSLLLFLKLVHFWHFLSLTINVCGSSHTFVLSLCSLVFVSSKKWKAFKALMNHPWSLMDVLVKGNNGHFFCLTQKFFSVYMTFFFISEVTLSSLRSGIGLRLRLISKTTKWENNWIN